MQKAEGRRQNGSRPAAPPAQAEMSELLEEAEKKAAQVLLPQLKDHLELIREFMNLIGESGFSLGMRPIDECTQAVTNQSINV